MIEKKFINNIYKFSLANLDESGDIKNDDFINYFKMIIDDSHILVKIGYYFLLYFFFIFYLITSLFFLPKRIEFKIFKILVNFLKKLPLFSEVFKFIKIHSLIFKYD